MQNWQKGMHYPLAKKYIRLRVLSDTNYSQSNKLQYGTATLILEAAYFIR